MVKESNQNLKKSAHLKRIGFILAAVWTAAIFLAFGWHIWDLYDLTLESVRIQAADAFEKDLVYRRWATNHGGVYVPVTAETPPNPHLSHIENRDITTTGGLDLTLVNPAYMTRQVHELGLDQYGHQGHITSLQPIRPENAPDAWELRALELFENGETELVELSQIGDQEYLRLMRPMITEASCLKCHAAQGYKEGDIRGGISVSIPVTPFMTRMYTHMAGVTFGYAFIWLVSLGGIFLSVSYVGRNLRQRELTAGALQKSEDAFRKLFQNMMDGFAVHEIILDDDGGPVDYRFLSVNPAFETLTGLTAEQTVGRRVLEVMPDLEPSWLEVYGKVALSGEPVRFENDSKDLGKHFEVCAYSPEPGKFACVFVDITERKRLEKEEIILAEQIQIAQKVESIGRLAGGMAHELNNLLAPILGYSEMLLNDFEPDDMRRESVDEILNAGSQARDLVQHLLAFGRRQMLEYRAVDLNETLIGLETMLKKIIREDIAIEIITSPDLPEIMADIGQIEEVVIDLSVNAQNAMPEGGRLTIETGLVDLDSSYSGLSRGVKQGPYVMFVVSDTGQGMDKETLDHIFEPFFTTKAELGSGLGLAKVYGIVKQHGGDVWAYSEPGNGTVFKVYLPAHTDGKPKVKATVSAGSCLTGSETIMLVEDNAQVRNLARAILERQGYKVLVAERGPEALLILESYEDKVQLLLTDVVMPEINGRDLFVKVAEKRPDMRVLFMSGYTHNVIAHHGVLYDDTDFIQKPFGVKDLALKVRQVLDR